MSIYDVAYVNYYDYALSMMISDLSFYRSEIHFNSREWARRERKRRRNGVNVTTAEIGLFALSAAFRYINPSVTFAWTDTAISGFAIARLQRG